MTPSYAPPRPLVSRAGRYLVIHEDSFAGAGLSSNVYVTEQDGSYYIFDASGSPDLISYVEATGIHRGYIAGIILTHGHYDHVRGLKSVAGLDLLPSDSPIQALACGSDAQALAWSAALEESGYWVPAIGPPTVPEGKARLRVTLSALHSPEQVDGLVDALVRARAPQSLAVSGA